MCGIGDAIPLHDRQLQKTLRSFHIIKLTSATTNIRWKIAAVIDMIRPVHSIVCQPTAPHQKQD